MIQGLGVPVVVPWSHSYWGSLVWGVLGLAWSGVMKLLERFLHISWHGDVHYACLILPVQCDTTVETYSPILCDIIFLLECMHELHCVLLYLVFYPKVVDH